MKIVIKRTKRTEVQTLGVLKVIDNGEIIYSCKTLELPWKENHHNISCIPAGEYQIQKRKSSHLGEHFHILNVKDRSYILIHRGNFYTDIRGCILVGKSLRYINKDKFKDVFKSSIAMKELYEILPDTFNLEIQ